jgi:hypothetical protein
MLRFRFLELLRYEFNLVTLKKFVLVSQQFIIYIYMLEINQQLLFY